MKNKEIVFEKNTYKLVKETSRARYYVAKNGVCLKQWKKTGEITQTLGFYNSATGYYQFANTYVHRLVAIAFLKKPHSKAKTQVDHIDGNRMNNSVENLRWVTRKENNSSEQARKLKKMHSWCNDHSEEIIEATKDGNVQFFSNGKHAAKALGCSHVLVYNALGKRGSARRAKGWELKWVAVGVAKNEDNNI